ncbi:MAG: hypothetical protein JJU05_19370 [Verrucomicrobia bacterium]|nr:hypothetical protein [Verrucomicrobiota bacterium]
MLNFKLLTYYLLALSYLVINVFIPSFSTIYGMGLATLIVWKKDINLLPVLMLLVFHKADFAIANRGELSHIVTRFEHGVIHIAGFPVSTAYWIIYIMTLCSIWTAFTSSLKSVKGKTFFFLLALLLSVLPVYMIYLGFLRRNPSWTNPLRMYFNIFLFFYGMLCWSQSRRFSAESIIYLLHSITILMILQFSSRFHHHFLWFIIAFVPALPLVLPMIRQKPIVLISFLISFILSCLFAFRNLFTTLLATEDYVDVEGTFTLNGLWALSFLLFIFLGVTFLTKLLKPFLIFWLIFFWVFPLTVIHFSPYMQGRLGGVRLDQQTLEERFLSKIFDDRSIIWRGLAEDVVLRDPVLRPGGQNAIIYHPRWGEGDLPFGAHNTPLNALVVLRWVAGPLVIFAFCLCGIAAYRTLILPDRDRVHHVLGIAVFSSMIIGGITGHYLLVSIPMLFFPLGGYLYARSREMKLWQRHEAAQ